MKKTLLLILTLTALLVLTGCQQQVADTTGYYKYTGQRAIEVKFLDGSPVSSEIDTYQPFENIEVIAEIINRLPEDVDVEAVRARLTGDAAIETFFTGAQEATSPTLYGIDLDTGIANPEELELGPIKYVRDITTKVPKKITGQYCYSLPVRVKANLFYTNKEAEIGTNLPGGSNPPSTVQVTQIDQGTVNIGDRELGELRFKVTVKNLGPGTVIPSLDDCFKFRDRSAREELTITADAAYPITCEDGNVRLSRTDGTKTVDCKVTGIDLTNLGPDASELTLILSGFAYEEDIPPVNIWLEE